MTSSRPLAPRPNPRPEAPRPESPLPRKVDVVGCRILTREFNFRLSVEKVAGTKMRLKERVQVFETLNLCSPLFTALLVFLSYRQILYVDRDFELRTCALIFLWV